MEMITRETMQMMTARRNEMQRALGTPRSAQERQEDREKRVDDREMRDPL